MRYVVTAEEMLRYDANTIEQIGIPGMVLMERAAMAARDRVLEVCSILCPNYFGMSCKPAGVLILAGMGNNGGDGLALARLLAEQDLKVEVWCVGDASKASEQWLMQRKILESYEVRFSDEPASEEYTILVDALFGVGLSREVTGEYRLAIERFDEIAGYKIALDVPSGICSDTGKVLGCAVRADETVTFAFGKRGLYLYPGCGYAGSVTVADIGINERSFGDEKPGMFCLDYVKGVHLDRRMKGALHWLPTRNGAGNKGTFGKVLLVAGSAGMAGAAILCARAAYRSGAGMVKVLTDESNRVIIQESVPEAMYGTLDALEESLVWADVVAIGPGIGKSKQAYMCLEKVICNSEKPLLIDADGLNLLAENEAFLQALSEQAARPVILTPHVGELSRLTKLTVAELKENLWQHAKMLAEQLHAVVVAKDARSFICAEREPICISIYGNSGMATAGSGDVLAGIVAGLWGQYSGNESENAFRAACAGVCLHGSAGDAVTAAKGEYALMAGDLTEVVADIMKSFRQ